MLSVVITWIMTRLPSARSERGQDLIEYALLSTLIAAALVAVIAAAVLTGAISTMITGISHCIDFKKSTACGPF